MKLPKPYMVKTTSEDVQPSPTPSEKKSQKGRKSRTHVTDEMVKTMYKMQKEGWNQTDIAELLGLAPNTVSRRLREYKPLKTAMTDHDRAEIVRLKTKGMTSKEVAIATHRGLSTVDKVWAAYKKENDVVVKRVIHRIGNELYNVDVDEAPPKKRDIPEIVPPVAENDVPMVSPDKVETTNAMLWLVITTVAFILGLAVAGL